MCHQLDGNIDSAIIPVSRLHLPTVDETVVLDLKYMKMGHMRQIDV